MLILATPDAVTHALADLSGGPTDILRRYRQTLLEELIATLFVLQPGDTASDLERARGHPFELWEFIELDGGWYEAVFIVSDDGFGHVVLVPDHKDSDPELLDICRKHAAA